MPGRPKCVAGPQEKNRPATREGRLEPFDLGEVKLGAGEAVDGGVVEGVGAELGGDAVEEGEAGVAVVARGAVEGYREVLVVAVVPAAAVDFDVAGDEVLVVPDLAIDECTAERIVRAGYYDKFRMHRCKNTQNDYLCKYETNNYPPRNAADFIRGICTTGHD